MAHSLLREVFALAQFVGALSRHPARVSFTWYAAGLALGAVLLAQPFARVPNVEPIDTIDAVFTATSAICVTGLGVRSTGHDFSWLGQIVILLLVQLGGIGIITVTTFVTLRLGGHQSLHNRTLLAQTLGTENEPNLLTVLHRVVRFTAIFEVVGALVLSARFWGDFAPLDALWHGAFHSISAFCNAGFSLNDNSLMAYERDWIVNLTVMALIIVGGIGYPVMTDVARVWRRDPGDRWDNLLLHTKLMIVGTAALIAIGTTAVLVLEWDHLLADLSIPTKILAATFQSVTSRTAGFNTLDTANLRDATLFVVILLMFIGAGPCSAAGGFKVSTLVILVLRAWTTFRGGSRVLVARRTIPEVVVSRAITTVLMFAAVAILGLIALLTVE